MRIVEVGPRDGLQNEKRILDTATKVGYIERLIAAGVTRMEAVSFAHPIRVPQMADAEAVMERVPRVDDVSYIGLVMNERGAHRAIGAGVDEANIVVVATDTFSQKNQGMTTQDSLLVTERTVGLLKEAGIKVSVTIGAAFGCPFEGRVEPETVLGFARQVAEAPPDELVLADTIGVGVPSQVGELVSGVRELGMTAGCHFHNTRNTGLANAVAAVEAGATLLDASVGGTGGCPFAPRATGNIATEDLVYLLHGMVHETGIDLGALIEVARWLSEQLGKELPGQVYRAGVFEPVAG